MRSVASSLRRRRQPSRLYKERQPASGGPQKIVDQAKAQGNAWDTGVVPGHLQMEILLITTRTFAPKAFVESGLGRLSRRSDRRGLILQREAEPRSFPWDAKAFLDRLADAGDPRPTSATRRVGWPSPFRATTSVAISVGGAARHDRATTRRGRVHFHRRLRGSRHSCRMAITPRPIGCGFRWSSQCFVE